MPGHFLLCWYLFIKCVTFVWEKMYLYLWRVLLKCRFWKVLWKSYHCWRRLNFRANGVTVLLRQTNLFLFSPSPKFFEDVKGGKYTATHSIVLRRQDREHFEGLAPLMGYSWNICELTLWHFVPKMTIIESEMNSWTCYFK